MKTNNRGILVYAEYLVNRVHPVTFELLGKARELSDKIGGKVQAILIGKGCKAWANELIYRGADEVYLYDDERLKEPDIIVHKRILARLIERAKPLLVMIGATPWGRSLAPRVAAALRVGLTADCIDIRVDEKGEIIQIRPAFTGNIIAHIRSVTRPVMATIRYKVFRPMKRNPRRSGKVITEKVIDEDLRDTGIKILSLQEKLGPKLSEAKIVVGVGRGLRKPEDIKIFEEFARLLGGVLGVSRPLVDEGWMPREYQIGFSGSFIKPRLYIACGISGAPQHLVAVRDSEVIIAINVDPSAPIFKVADYGVVADMYEVIPKLVDYLRRKASSKA